MSDPNPTPYSPPGINHRVPKPPGVLPRHAQAWVIGGVALLMVVVIAFSGKNAPKERTRSMPSVGSTVVDPNDARIQEYRTRIEEQARKLSAEQAMLAQTRRPAERDTPPVAALGDERSVSSTPASEDWIAVDRAKRTYQSLFSSNLALSYRVRLEARRKQPGLPAVTMRDLLTATLRLRPDRILVGEVRGGEAFDLLQALNTGHAGTLATIHANSARQALSRFTTCVLQADVGLPYSAIRASIADSVNLLVHLARRQRRRQVAEVVAIRRYEPAADHFDLETVYEWERP